MTRRPAHLLAACVFACAAATMAQAAEVRVAVASNFAGPFTKIGESFTAATGHTLKVATGATGRFHAQIAAGAPFQVLLAADDETPKRLIAEGLAVSGSSFTYATGKLVLWSAQPGVVDDQGAVLASGNYRYLAIANPKVAPYGRAAMEVLSARGLTARAAPRLVTGESIAQAHHFVASGNAQLGFVAQSQVLVPGKPVLGSHWVVPPSLHAPIRQDAVLLKAGQGSVAARALLDHLKTPAVQGIVESYGYGR